MLLAFPLAAIIVVALADTPVAKFLSQRWLVWFGTMSYSIYLTHTIAIEILVKEAAPQTVIGSVSISLLATLLTYGLSFFLHRWLEEPYFRKEILAATRPKPTLASSNPTTEFRLPILSIPSRLSRLSLAVIKRFTSRPIFSTHSHLWMAGTLGALQLVVLITIWLVNRPTFPLTSLMHRQTISLSPDRQLTQTETTPLEFTFTARANNLGIVTIPLVKKVNEKIYAEPTQKPTLIIKVFDQNGLQIADNQHDLTIIGDGSHFPIGLPIQSSSANQTYRVELSIKNHPRGVTVSLGNHGKVELVSVAFPHLSSLFAVPRDLLTTAFQIAIFPFTSRLAQLELALIIPSLLYFTIFELQKIDRRKHVA